MPHCPKCGICCLQRGGAEQINSLGVLLGSTLLSLEAQGISGFSGLEHIRSARTFPRQRQPDYNSPCSGNQPNRLLQCTLYGATFKDTIEAAASTEYNTC